RVARAPRPVAHHRERAPQRSVLDQLVAGELLREDPLAEGDGLVLGGPVHSGLEERLLGALHDEGALALLVPVRVYLEEAVLGLVEVESERVEWLGRAEPDEAVRPE